MRFSSAATFLSFRRPDSRSGQHCSVPHCSPHRARCSCQDKLRGRLHGDLRHRDGTRVGPQPSERGSRTGHLPQHRSWTGGHHVYGGQLVHRLHLPREDQQWINTRAISRAPLTTIRTRTITTR